MGNQTGGLYAKGKNTPHRHHGLAFGVINEQGTSVGGQGSPGTFYWGGYFNTQGFADPKEKIIALIMKQTRGRVSDDTDWKFRILALHAVDD